MQDNFKSLYGPCGLTFRGATFGTKLVRKKNTHEAGMVIMPRHLTDSRYIVVGFAIARVKRQTTIDVLLMPEDVDSNIGICTLSYDHLCQICEDPHRHQPATEESLKTCLLARQIAGLVSKGAQALVPLSVGDIFGKPQKPPRKRSRVTTTTKAKVVPAIVRFF